MPRRAAYDVLEAVLGHKHSLDATLETQDSLNALNDRDRAFARTLIMTVLRRLGQIDALISSSLERRLPQKARGVRNILRLGIAQVLFLSTATHAAVNETVDMSAGLGFTAQKKLVNAILRKMSRDGQ